MDEHYIYACALNRIFCFRPALGRQLIERYGVRKLFSAGRKELEELFCGDGKLVSLFAEETILEWSRKEVEWAGCKGVRLLEMADALYPPLLKECPDAPLMLYSYGEMEMTGTDNVSYCYGEMEMTGTDNVAIVGTRLAPDYGREACRTVVSSLEGSGAAVVSGLAFGIDITAHRAALECGLESIAVLPCGIDMVYPAAHREDAARTLPISTLPKTLTLFFMITS